MTMLIYAGAQTHIATKAGYSPLYIAAREGRADRQGARWCRRGARVDQEARNRVTPLSIAFEHGHVSVMPVLLKARADVNSVKNDDSTSLIVASYLGKAECVQLLLDATRAEGVAGAARRWRHGARQCDQAEARRGGALASRRCESSRARRRTPFRTRFKVHGDDEVMFDEVGSPTRRRVRMRGETAAAAAGAAKEEMRKMTCVRV